MYPLKSNITIKVCYVTNFKYMPSCLVMVATLGCYLENAHANNRFRHNHPFPSCSRLNRLLIEFIISAVRYFLITHIRWQYFISILGPRAKCNPYGRVLIQRMQIITMRKNFLSFHALNCNVCYPKKSILDKTITPLGPLPGEARHCRRAFSHVQPEATFSSDRSSRNPLIADSQEIFKRD